ncbi:hypothetical protein FC756_15840 [Lysinibacillus mangiferihumi]|uniref:DUF3923 family protein n=1 Tax=Lysinibacillus mangiferihumi TaxID=1130819 RepID=A0A4V5TL06_9BACI|nr:hypothetical protein [Lysinibacillus mangiferihumi]TKI65843.1 hypothetical protein FC756_15840 [Lysinibacillus mangiferihumi]
MFKYWFIFLIVLVTQTMFIFFWAEHVWLYKFVNGGVGGTITEQINPVFWQLLIGEVIVFLLLMIFNRYKFAFKK